MGEDGWETDRQMDHGCAVQPDDGALSVEVHVPCQLGLGVRQRIDYPQLPCSTPPGYNPSPPLHDGPMLAQRTRGRRLAWNPCPCLAPTGDGSIMHTDGKVVIPGYKQPPWSFPDSARSAMLPSQSASLLASQLTSQQAVFVMVEGGMLRPAVDDMHGPPQVPIIR